MKREHSTTFIRINEIAEKLGEMPLFRAYNPAAMIRSASEGKQDKPDKDDRSVTFTLSTGGMKRDGFEIRTDGWQLENFRKNPVVLWNHNHTGNSLPIAKSLREWKANDPALGRVLRGQADFLTKDLNPFAERVYSLYRAGILNAVSVGWKTLKSEWVKDDEGYITGIRFLENDLLEYSAVPVPADPDALQRAFRESMVLDEERGLFVRSTDHPEDTYIFGAMVDQQSPERTPKTTVDLFAKAREEVMQAINPNKEESSSSHTEDRPPCPDFCNYHDLFAAEDSRSAFTQFLQSIHRGSQEHRDHVALHFACDGMSTPPWDTFSGRQYLAARTALQEKTYGDELGTIRKAAVEAAQKLYGEHRLLEEWEWQEDGTCEHPIAPEMIAIRSTLFEALTDHIADRTHRTETVLCISRVFDEAMARYAMALTTLNRITTAARTNAIDHIVATLEQSHAPSAASSDNQDFLSEVSEATSRLERTLKLESEEIIKKDLTIEEELRHIFRELMDSPPVAGSDNQ